MGKLSPMMEQYMKTKDKYKDCIVFYRLGDFYEMFFDDAIKASSLLELTLTGRDCGLEERAPMCGIPHHAAEEYIAKLVNLGEKVAICEQLSDPKETKGIVERDIVRIVTAGTLTNSELIDNKINNFIACVYLCDKKASISWTDITTGEFFAKDLSCDKVINEITNELVKISPAEIIANDEVKNIFDQSPLVLHGVLPKFSSHLESDFNYNIAKANILSKFNIHSVTAFKIDENSPIVNSSGALLSYLKETQKHALINISNILVENTADYVMLDANAIRNLEITKTIHDGKRFGSLLWLMDKTKTSMGARKLQNWLLFPLNSKDKITSRLDAVDAFFKSTIIRQSLYDVLGGVKDVGRLAGKISNGNLTPKDCLLLKKSLEVIPSIKFQLSGVDTQLINDLVDNLGDFSDIVKLISDSIEEEPPALTKNGGYIKKGFNNELDELRSIASNGKILLAQLENKEREFTGIKTLKIAYNRVFGYYIEVTNSFKDKVPDYYIRRQTISNAERYVTDELKDLESKIINSDGQSITLELKLYNEIKTYLSNKIDDLIKCADALARLDVLVSLSVVARENGFVRPEICDYSKPLNIVDGRHPVVEKISKNKFVPNDVYIDSDENNTLIITGPNMAGKSTYMRQVAIITLMAHVGSFVPAKSAEIPLTDRIFTRIGASDNLISDQSTFMVEMSEIADILSNATSNSLVILDEIGRGTSTFDGLSIAWAVLEYFATKIRSRTMFATHYHELTELEGILPGVKNYKITVKEVMNSIIFLRKIMRGGANRSFGIEVAQLAGVDKTITERAKQILKTLEKQDVTKVNNTDVLDYQPKENYSQVENIIKELDLDNLSPMQAFNVLVDLKEKLKD